MRPHPFTPSTLFVPHSSLPLSPISRSIFTSPLRSPSSCPSPPPSSAPSPPRRPRRSIPRALLLDFSPSDFELRRLVGQQGYATIVDWEYYGTRDPLAPTRTVEPSEPAVRLYDARISTSVPQLANARVLLKEFLTAGVELGVNEAQAYKLLYEADGVANIDPDVVPVATLLGTFLVDDSFGTAAFAMQWARRFPKSPKPPRPGAPFLVFRWEGMLTGLSCAGARDTDVDPGTRLLNRWFPGNLVARKAAFLRMFMRRSLDALLYLHATAGVVHRAVGLASIMVNTTEYRMASSLQVKIQDLGFAKPVSELVGGEGLERARRAGAVSPREIAAFYFAEDVYALGYTFLELLFSTFAQTPVTQDKFKMLFEDTFKLDSKGFRDYCAADGEWTEAVALLDEDGGAGWELIRAMLGARAGFARLSLQELGKSRFLQGIK